LSWEWAKEFFIRHADIFLRIMNERWHQAIEEAKWIIKILEANDIFEGKILDVMCGNGRHAVYLAEKGYRVVGVDICPLFIEDAKRKAARMNVDDNTTFIVGDFRELDNLVEKYSPFDAVINFWTSIGYYGEKADYILFQKARKVSRRGAILILGDTLSKENLLDKFSPFVYAEFNNLLVLHFMEYDPLESILTDLWRFYDKRGNDWVYLTSVKVKLRVYSISEIVRMLKEAGWNIIAAYDSIIGLTPLQRNSKINIVAKAINMT